MSKSNFKSVSSWGGGGSSSFSYDYGSSKSYGCYGTSLSYDKGSCSWGYVDSWCKPPTPVATEGALLFTENFGAYPTTTGEWHVVNLSATGWTSTGGVTEVAQDGFHGVSGSNSGYWLDTQGSPGGIDISHKVTDSNGGKAQISLTLAVQQFDEWLTSSDLQIIWNGQLVDTVTVAEVLLLGPTRTFQEVNVVVDSLAGTDANTLQLRDMGISYVGFALDLVQVHDWIV